MVRSTPNGQDQGFGWLVAYSEVAIAAAGAKNVLS
jgi:hypothetical protein